MQFRSNAPSSFALVVAMLFMTFSTPIARAAGSDQVLIKDFMFAPMSITVKTGATISWLNKDDEPHTVISDTGLFRSGALDTNDKFSFKFEKPGAYHFTCSIHPRMVGAIVVE